MKKILSICVAAIALSFAAPANAADIPMRAPYTKYPPVNVMPVFNWTGFYVGGHVGYGFGDFFGTDIDGFKGGVQVGYNWQFSRNIVFGIEGDFSGTDINGLPGGFPYHVDYLGTARARVGYAWDRTMIYGTGGFAFTKSSLGGIHDTDMGYALGAGLEWAFSSAWTAKAEYMFYSFENNFDVSAVKLGFNYRFGY